MDFKATEEVAKETLTETFLNFTVDLGKEFLKEQGLSLLSETALSVGLSAIPVLGASISNYKTARAIKNLGILINSLEEDIDAIRNNLNNMSVEVKRDLDKLFLYVLEKTSEEKQEEKIKFFASSFVKLTGFQSLDVGISYIYYDILSQMTILDIQVLLEMKRGFAFYYLHPEEDRIIDLPPEQLRAIKSNLERLGLVVNEFVGNVDTDIENINNALTEYYNAIIELQEKFAKDKIRIHNIKSKSKAKVPKLKAKHKLHISQFGNEMIEFFGEIAKNEGEVTT